MSEKIEITGIKCDNKNCDFHDDSVRIEDYEQWLNKPCPKCSSNLLTQADYDLVRRLVKINNSKFFQAILWFLNKLERFVTCKPKIIIRTFDGSGKLKKPKKNDN